MWKNKSIQKLKDNTNITDEETKQIDDFIYDAIYNINKDQISIIKKVQDALNIIPEYTRYLCSINNKFAADSYIIIGHINSFDKLYFTKSKLQTRFNNLYNKVINTFDRMSNDDAFDHETRNKVTQDDIIYMRINRFLLFSLMDSNTNELQNIANNILNYNGTHLSAKEYFRQILKIFNVTNKILNNKIQQNLILNHDSSCIKEDQDNIMWYYVLLLNNVADRKQEYSNKYLIQYQDFVKLFEDLYDYVSLPNMRRESDKIVLIYPDGKSPEKTAKHVLDNPDKEFIIPYDKVNSLQTKIDIDKFS